MVHNTKGYQVLTDQGWKSFDGVKRVTSNYNYTFTYQNIESGEVGKIKVTAKHRFVVGKTRRYGKITRPAYKIQVGHRISFKLAVIAVMVSEEPETFYDFINVEGNHTFLTTDGINHHNCDEMAWIEDKKIKGFLDSAMPALSSGKDVRIAFISTPNGFNTFYRYSKEAEAGNQSQIQDHLGINGFTYLEYDYTCVPGRDETWFEEKVAEEGILQATRNYKVRFLGSADTLVSSEKLMDMESKCINPIDYYDLAHPDFKIFEYPIKQEGIYYTIGCDSAKISATSKKNSDFLSIQVLKIDIIQRTITQVASLKTRDLHYTDTARILDSIGRYYNNGWIFVENNSEGQAIVDSLFDKYEYENIFSSSKRNDVFGFRTDKTNRSIGISNLRKLLRMDVLRIYDRDFVNELHTFVKNSKGRYEAQTADDHDDMIFALLAALFWIQDDVNEMDITIHDFINKNKELPDLTIFENQENEDLEDVAGIFFASGCD